MKLIVKSYLYRTAYNKLIDTYRKGKKKDEMLSAYYHTAVMRAVNLDNDLDEKVSTMLFRIVQELTHNIFKHAQAKNVLIQVIQNDNILNLLVEDDGVGFDISKLKVEGIGLTNIRSRVEFLQGKVDFDSVVDEGTTVNISIPV